MMGLHPLSQPLVVVCIKVNMVISEMFEQKYFNFSSKFNSEAFHHPKLINKVLYLYMPLLSNQRPKQILEGDMFFKRLPASWSVT